MGYEVVFVEVIKAYADQKALWEGTAAGWRVGSQLRDNYDVWASDCS